MSAQEDDRSSIHFVRWVIGIVIISVGLLIAEAEWRVVVGFAAILIGGPFVVSPLIDSTRKKDGRP